MFHLSTLGSRRGRGRRRLFLLFVGLWGPWRLWGPMATRERRGARGTIGALPLTLLRTPWACPSETHPGMKHSKCLTNFIRIYPRNNMYNINNKLINIDKPHQAYGLWSIEPSKLVIWVSWSRFSISPWLGRSGSIDGSSVEITQTSVESTLFKFDVFPSTLGSFGIQTSTDPIIGFFKPSDEKKAWKAGEHLIQDRRNFESFTGEWLEDLGIRQKFVNWLFEMHLIRLWRSSLSFHFFGSP